jgi:hypothetical protein
MPHLVKSLGNFTGISEVEELPQTEPWPHIRADRSGLNHTASTRPIHLIFYFWIWWERRQPVTVEAKPKKKEESN